MHADRRLLGWGIFLVILGVVPLAVQTGLVDRSIAVQTWRLWPLLLVGAGIGLLLRSTRATTAGGLIVPATLGLIGGGLLAGGGVDFGAVACGSGSDAGRTFERAGALGPQASVRIEMRCGDLTVHRGNGSSWSVSGTADPDAQPTITATEDRLTIRSGSRGLFLPGFGGARERWDVALPAEATIDLSATVSAGMAGLDLRGGRYTSVGLTANAGTVTMDLDGATVESLNLTLNAGDARIVLPDASLDGSMTVNAGSIEFCAPPTVGLRVHTNDNLTGSFDYAAAGLVRDGSSWTSSNYTTATHRIELSTTANAGSFSLNPRQGCR
jgi:cell wall-active antibiotic response 4TMS protein YvqF